MSAPFSTDSIPCTNFVAPLAAAAHFEIFPTTGIRPTIPNPRRTKACVVETFRSFKSVPVASIFAATPISQAPEIIFPTTGTNHTNPIPASRASIPAAL